MSGICNDGSDLILTAKELQKWVDTFSTWLNGDETTFVVLGDKEVPSIRNLVAMIDERESNAAQTAIDGGMQQIVIARNQVIQMRDAIYRMFSEMDATTATAETLPPEAAATAHWDTERRVLSLGIPQGRKGDKGDKGDVGPRGLPPIVDVISCGGSEDVWLTVIEGGNSVTPEDEFHYPDPPTGT